MPAPRNRTLSLSEPERISLRKQLLEASTPLAAKAITNKIVCGDTVDLLPQLPKKLFDLLILDPPYNISKKFNTNTFKARDEKKYEEWFESWFAQLLPLLKPTASLYICSEWATSTAIYNVLQKYVTVRNRITWEREKGRGAANNWKNSSEDIWFATMSDEYVFNLDDVKLRRKVLAPYKDVQGNPKDWDRTEHGDYRDTHPSNLWTDITVPFWSMKENTEHPTQKPEKLIAKLILASTKKNGFVFDPFLGSGTTAVVAKKLGRKYFGIEQDEEYALLAAKRLRDAELDKTIQGYSDGIFWERNTPPPRRKS
ncbi:MAG TPA: DNA methyltransferase [Candidatus Kapabacteria bacterium]